MKKNILLSFLFIFYVTIQTFNGHAQTMKRILFLGNSITYAGFYITQVETYFITHRPGEKFLFMNLGLPSETVSGLSEEGHAGGRFVRPDLHERIDRVLALTAPDLVFVCYGMNDGIYLPFDEERFGKYKKGLLDVYEKVIHTGAKVIFLTPPFYDEKKGKQVGYGNTLDKYADWLLSQKKKAGWEVIDIHYPMKKFTEAHRRVDEQFAISSFALAEDGVHPGLAGHWIIAKQILLHLGEKEVKKETDIDAAISGFKNGTEILKLVSQRQMMMKDAWLTAARHTRPEMKTGIPLNEAMSTYAETEQKIRQLME